MIETGALAIAQTNAAATDRQPPREDLAAIGWKFEQMLWAEMLSHAGLEKSLTLGGGEAASAFSRHLVEAIAEDLAERQPLGIAEAISAGTQNGEAAE